MARAAAGLLALLLGAGLGAPGCGGAGARPLGPAAPVVRRYLPTDLRQAAQTPGVGVVVGTSAEGASAIFELAALPREVDIAVVRQSAGVARVRLRAEAGGPGAATTSAEQLAALRTVGKRPSDIALRLDAPPGDVNPARSSAALAVGWLAALTGANVRPDAIVLGRVTADGLLLPSPDLPAAIAEARDAGMRVIVVPAGYGDAAAATDTTTGTATDTSTGTSTGTATGTATDTSTGTATGTGTGTGTGTDSATSTGAEAGTDTDAGRGAAPAPVRVVACLDLDEAYIAATDHQLPRSSPPPAAGPATDPARTTQIVEALRRWSPADPSATWHALLVLEQRPRAPASAVALARAGRASAELAGADAGASTDEARRLAGATAHVRITGALLIDAIAGAVDRGGEQLPAAVEAALARAGVAGAAVSDSAAALHALLRDRPALELTYRARPQLLELLDRLAEAVAEAWLRAEAPDLLAEVVDEAGADALALELAAVAPTARPGWHLWGLAEHDAPPLAATAAAAARARLLAHRAHVVHGAVPDDVAAALANASRLDGAAPAHRLLAWRWYRLAARLADAAVIAGLQADRGAGGTPR